MKISPKQFLKTRRIEQFSDSEVISESQIDSTILDYYLDTLASRSQEVEFERFSIRLCKAVITPNLIPNTGPTGGGDGKVDSETYPVSETTASGWYTAIDPKAANERWGFAISIQKEWGKKIRDDVKKAYETKRNYKVIYYVSSRFIRAKDKARVQDELGKKYKLDVRILDKSWILKEIFEGRHQDIAKEELKLARITETKTKKGPIDSQRENNLEHLDKEIEKAIAENEIILSTVDDAIHSAILSRELEKPRIEVDGRFDRSERLAQEYGSLYQQFETAYQHAWTTFWWHEDFSTYIKLYKVVEDRAINIDHVYSLERLTNLWYCLNTVKNQEEGGKQYLDSKLFEKHTDILKNKLKEIREQKADKPNSALCAYALLMQIELNESIFAGKNIDNTIVNLKGIIEESKYFVGFPFKSLVRILTELGDILGTSSEYDYLFQSILRVTEERDGEIAGAKLSLNRAEQLIKLDRSYQAIIELGNSLRKLHKHESRDDAVRALFLIRACRTNICIITENNFNPQRKKHFMG